MNFVRACVASLVSLGMLCSSSAKEPPREASTSFLRFVEEKDGSARLEVAESTYRNDDGVSVTLIGAVHIADGEYYRGLDASFDHYDALLYELVRQKDAGVPTKGQESNHWIGRLQQAMQKKLELKYQLHEINYDRPNFVHADMDWETFSARQDERNESLFLLSLKASLAGTEGGNINPNLAGFAIIGAMGDPNSAYHLKYIMGRMFSDMDKTMETLADDTVIISERNEAALKVLKEQIGDGKRNLGVFYGAGHLKSMEESLIREMNFKKVGTVWRTAWDIGKPPTRTPTTKPSTKSASLLPR